MPLGDLEQPEFILKSKIKVSAGSDASRHTRNDLVSFSIWQWPRIPHALELVGAEFQPLPLLLHGVLLVCLFAMIECDFFL